MPGPGRCEVSHIVLSGESELLGVTAHQDRLNRDAIAGGQHNPAIGPDGQDGSQQVLPIAHPPVTPFMITRTVRWAILISYQSRALRRQKRFHTHLCEYSLGAPTSAIHTSS